MSERTLEQALLRADELRVLPAFDRQDYDRQDDQNDLVLLADEVERLRSDGVTSGLSIGEEMGKLHNEVEFLNEQTAALEAENRALRSTSSSKTEQRATEHYRKAYQELADEVKRLRAENEDLQIDLGSADAMIQTEFG